MTRSLLACLAVLCALPAAAQSARTVGRTSDTTGITANNWSLTPAGAVIPVDEMPQGCLLSLDGKWLAVVNCGQGAQSVMLLDAATRAVKAKATLRAPKAVFHGLAFSRDGKTLYVSGGPSDILRVYSVPDLKPADPEGVLLRAHADQPCTVNPETFAGKITLPDPTKAGTCLYPIGIALAPDGKTVWMAEALGNAIAIVDPVAGKVVQRIAVGPYPYEICFTPDGRKAYVSLWGQAKVAVVDVAAKVGQAQIPVGQHPCALCLDPAAGRLYVANAHSDTVSIIDTRTDKVVGTLAVSPYPGAPMGTVPNALALSPDGRTLYVAEGGNNCLDIVALNRGRTGGTVRGRIPTGWYPTGVQVQGDTLWITSAKGVGSVPNAYPIRRYIAQCVTGICQAVAVPDAAQLARYDQQVRENNFTSNGQGVRMARRARATSPIPRRLGDPSPIKYCIYIIKENRTYDQVFGDLPQGNGDPNLTLFGRDVTPNQHNLAEKYVLLDNFYCDGAVSVDGHQWCKGANVSDAVEKGWGISYSQRGPQLGGPVANPAGGWLWERAAQAKVPARVYWSSMGKGEDLRSVQRTLTDIHGWETSGEMPRLIIMHLPNNHTFGTAKGKQTPKAMVAENDLAVGQLIEALAKTKFWPEMCVFIVEDDAQDGPDHVDCHRSPALVIGPWVKRGIVDRSFYDHVAVVRTIELILGLQPLSQFDAAAVPMFSLFMNQPIVDGYESVMPQQSLDEMTVAGAYGQEECMAMNFSEVDEAPWPALNRILWHSIKGVDTPLPPIRHTRFVMAVSAAEEGD